MTRRLATLLITAVALAACAPAGIEYEPPDHYEYRVQYSAFAPAAGTWDIEVRSERVVSFAPVHSGTAERAERFGITAQDLWTLEHIIASFNKALRTEGTVAHREEDAAGVPTVVSIDWEPDAVDDEDYWQILSVTPLD